MATKGAKGMKKAIKKVVHNPYLKVLIPAGMASAAPPLGPQLGQRSIQIAAFCKEFNEKTANIKKGIPLPCRILTYSDRTFDLVIHNPPATYFLKQAAGAQRAAMKTGQEVAGVITLKHIYEMALIKMKDPPFENISLQEVCKRFIGTAHSCGFKIVQDISLDEFKDFMVERKETVEKQDLELEEMHKAKMLRL